jgi:GNAT superfamily N-acetyltransferase
MIRPANLQDAPHIATIKIESWREAYAHILKPETLNNLRHAEQTERFHDYIQNQEHILVATNPQNEPIAYSLWIQLQDSQQPPDSRRTSKSNSVLIKTDWPYPNMLASLYVHPSHYRKGLGTALIRANAELAIAHNHKGMMIGVFTQNTKAKSLYTKLGAEYVKSTTFTVDGTTYPDELLAFHDLLHLTAEK